MAMHHVRIPGLALTVGSLRNEVFTKRGRELTITGCDMHKKRKAIGITKHPGGCTYNTLELKQNQPSVAPTLTEEQEPVLLGIKKLSWYGLVSR